MPNPITNYVRYFLPGFSGGGHTIITIILAKVVTTAATY